MVAHESRAEHIQTTYMYTVAEKELLWVGIISQFSFRKFHPIFFCFLPSLLQCHKDLCERVLGGHPQRARAADEHSAEAAEADGHHCVRGGGRGHCICSRSHWEVVDAIVVAIVVIVVVIVVVVVVGVNGAGHKRERDPYLHGCGENLPAPTHCGEPEAAAQDSPHPDAQGERIQQRQVCAVLLLPCCLFDLSCFFLPSFCISH